MNDFWRAYVAPIPLFFGCGVLYLLALLFLAAVIGLCFLVS